MEGTSGNPVIRIENSNIYNSGNLVISNLNLCVSPGEFIYLIGKVGSGKTSIIKALIGETEIRNGSASVNGFNLLKLKSRHIPRLRRTIGVIFQDFQLLKDRSVYDNLLFVLKATGWRGKRETDRRIQEVLRSVGLEHKAHKMPGQLSGGEQQRVAIARSLLNRPCLILADEPTGNLDAETTTGIMDLLMQINRQEGTAIIMVTHNTGLLKTYPARTFLCEDMSCTQMQEEEERQTDITEFI